MPVSSSEVGELRELMEGFLQERLAGKVEKLAPDDPKRDIMIAQFEFRTWVAEAARRVGQLQVVNFSLKPIHPDAKGTNLYVPPETLVKHALVGSHTLGKGFEEDVVGNAASLDVYKFLKLELHDRSILRRALEDDEVLALSLSSDLEESARWMQAFAGIVRSEERKASHTLAKQLYWLVGDDPAEDGHYHLLAPLYSTSLAHRVFKEVNGDRFGEQARAAREAKKANKYFETGYREYPNLAVQKIGGTKPQNISQLNSERGGSNYLLASLPPSWESREIRWPRFTESVFSGFFAGRRNVRYLIKSLRKLLKSNPNNTIDTRRIRDEYVQNIIDELILLAIELRQLEAGWSAEPECQLNESEALWLDSDRVEIDKEFAERRKIGEWRVEVCQRFGNWLNSELANDFPVADAEHLHWVKVMESNLDVLREVINHD